MTNELFSSLILVRGKIMKVTKRNVICTQVARHSSSWGYFAASNSTCEVVKAAYID